VRITQSDIRELQLAKGAIAAGFEILRGGASIAQIHLAGAFGNYVSIQSADRIGLLDSSSTHITHAGNTALRGLKKLLALGPRREEVIERYRTQTLHVPLASDPYFQEIFADNMAFPEAVRR
jgi:uncharacterized 2Fe-2S/4Fe-4S cluster protein (DUF4445 family)